MASVYSIRITFTLSKSVIAQSISRASQALEILQILLFPRTGWLPLIQVCNKSHTTPRSTKSSTLSMMMIVDPPNVGYQMKVAICLMLIGQAHLLVDQTMNIAVIRWEMLS